MENSNHFENLGELLQSFKNSKIPKDRLAYLKNIKTLIDIGERLYKLKESEELKKNIEGLKKIAEEYKIYETN